MIIFVTIALHFCLFLPRKIVLVNLLTVAILEGFQFWSCPSTIDHSLISFDILLCCSQCVAFFVAWCMTKTLLVIFLCCYQHVAFFLDMAHDFLRFLTALCSSLGQWLCVHLDGVVFFALSRCCFLHSLTVLFLRYDDGSAFVFDGDSVIVIISLQLIFDGIIINFIS